MMILSTPAPWDQVAVGYDEHTRPVLEHFSRRALELLGVSRGARVLDVGCGPGTTAALLAAAGHRVDAIDFSRSMIRRLQSKLQAGSPLSGARITPYQMDGQALQFKDNTFDGAVSMFGLVFFPNRARGLSELHRVLKPGTRVCISSWLPVDEVPAVRWLLGAARAIAPQKPDADAETALPMTNRHSIEHELGAAGFSQLHIERCRQSSPMPVDLTTFWETAAKSDAGIAALRHQLGEQQWEALSPTAIRHLEQTRPTIDSFNLDAWLAVGQKEQSFPRR